MTFLEARALRGLAAVGEELEKGPSRRCLRTRLSAVVAGRVPRNARGVAGRCCLEWGQPKPRSR